MKKLAAQLRELADRMEKLDTVRRRGDRPTGAGEARPGKIDGGLS